MVKHSRTATKGQALADFIAEFTGVEEDSKSPKQPQGQTPQKVTNPPEENNQAHVDPALPIWILHVDSSSDSTGSRAGLILTSPDQMGINYTLCFNFKAYNNEAEYEPS